MGKRTLGYLIFVVLFLLLTFFGMGPVLMADGSMNERIITLIFVLLGYMILGGVFRFWRKRNK
ncbi:protein-S-isoprenylcysteine O-methyltransferase Ste14 [Anaerosolibacter carboniphilus]|uniref:Protein-S-isoprenylcysteine O-methyltransferase Ste14 n=1 Tax=Anaerosolibacter carboniphilus TaxID=1417629 RepID=A0A841KPZ3_9FIRM|nr:hypothetical protein [Anaerosolibacter carboniphilus]MBB6215546.1 protein-S-isoprenylcysteine O-methyltransferase Ste14 [Anaerosolibacter carboniphilus]